jgi:Peptidase family M48
MTMTASSATRSRPTVTARAMPPWLWVWLAGYLLATMPLEISLLHFTIGTYFGHESALPQVTGDGFIAVERLSLAFDLMIYAVMVAGAASTLFPRLRGRWVEWRFKLAVDDRPVMAEMQRFVSYHDPSISLRVTIQSGQMARIYPVGWRSARIAVFRPLPALWHRDRRAAQAILLHEIAHRRQGDQLIVGLGSPFIMLMRIWVPAYLLFVFIPATIYLTAGRSFLAPFIAFSSIMQAVLVPAAIFLPVTALWLAELGADQMAAHAVGATAVRQALRATAGSRTALTARALALLSHPPRRLRLRLAVARPAGLAGLVAAWPAALAAWLLVLPVALTVPALLLMGFPAALMGADLRAAMHVLLTYARPVVAATAVLLLAWPVLEYPWGRLWSAAPRPRRHQRWWPYLAAASLPIGMLLASLLPPGAGLSAGLTSRQPTGACAQFTSWELGSSQTEEEHVQADVGQLQLGTGRITAPAAQHLDGEIRAALDNPPPGAARSLYAEALTGYRTAVTELRAGHRATANRAINNATGQVFQAETLLARLGRQCAPS